MSDAWGHRLNLIGDAWWQKPGRIVCDLWDWTNYAPPSPWLQKWLRLRQKDMFNLRRVTPPK